MVLGMNNQLTHEQILQTMDYKEVEIEKSMGYGPAVGANRNLKQIFADTSSYYDRLRQKYGKLWKRNVTIYDMMRIQYPHMYDDNLIGQISKVDAPLLSSTTASYVATHGSNAFSQIVQEDNLFKIIPKEPYVRGGYRAITAAGATTGTGVAENANVPDTVKPTLANVDIGIKEVAHSFNVSARNQFLSTIQDDAWAEGGDALTALRTYSQIEFNKRMNRQLLTDNEDLASNNFESIDRIVGSYSEIAGVGQTAGDLDIYGLDRDAGATWTDAYVNHNSGTDRDLNLSQLRDVMANVKPYWGGPGTGQVWNALDNKIWLTGFDTAARIEEIFESQNQYINNGARVDITLNGVRTLPKGSSAGFLVSELYGIPMFLSNDVPKDTISRMYLLDLSHLKISMGVATQYFEGGFSSGSVIELDQFQDKGVYYMMGELKATKFKVHGKLRDLK